MPDLHKPIRQCRSPALSLASSGLFVSALVDQDSPAQLLIRPQLPPPYPATGTVFNLFSPELCRALTVARGVSLNSNWLSGTIALEAGGSPKVVYLLK